MARDYFIQLLVCLLCITHALCAHFAITGHWPEIEPNHIRGNEENFVEFSEHEKRLFDKVKLLLDTHILEEFFVDHFEIHAEEIGKPTTVFKGFLTTTLNRPELIDTITGSKEIFVFHLMEIDFLPKRSSVLVGNVTDGVSYCYSNGVLLPNNTCACPPFTSGPTCEADCQNQGVGGGPCSCPPGYFGRSCESQTCLPSLKTTFAPEKQKFLIVLNQKSSMAYVLNTLLLQISSIIESLNATCPNCYDQYGVLYYIESDNFATSGLSFFPAAYLKNYYDFLAGLHIMDGYDMQPTQWALQIIDNQPLTLIKYTNFFIFVDSLDSKVNETTYQLTEDSFENKNMLHNLHWRNRFIYLLSQQNEPLDTSAGDFYDVFRRTSQGTLGDIVSYDNREINLIMSLIFLFQAHETIAARYLVKSTEETTIALPADDSNQEVYVLVTVEPNGEFPNVTYHCIDKNVTLCKSPILQGKRFMIISLTGRDSTSVTIKGTTPWSLRAFVHSTTTAFVAYDFSDQIDAGARYVPSEYPTVATAAQYGPTSDYLILDWTDLNTGVSSKTVTSTNRTDECSHNFFFGNMEQNCTPGPFGQLVTFYKAGNMQATRLLPGRCVHIDHPSPPMPVCLFNGTMDIHGYCSCADEHFSGLNCEIPVCSNRGTPNPYKGNGQPWCFCPPGFQGEFCEFVECSLSSRDSFDLSNRTLSVVVQSTMSQAWVNSKISTGVTDLLQSSNDSFAYYVLTKFYSQVKNGNYSDSQRTQVTDDPVTFLERLSSTFVGYTASSADSMSTLSALTENIKSMKFLRSAIFLFTDSPFRGSSDDEHVLMKLVIERGHELNIIITPQFGYSDLCMSTHDSSKLLSLAKTTGGLFLNLCNSYGTYSQDPIVQLFAVYADLHAHVVTSDQAYAVSSSTPVLINYEYSQVFAEMYAIVNSDTTEKFVAYIEDYENLTSIVDMPFVAIYPLKTDTTSNSFFVVQVEGAPNTAVSKYLYVRIVEKSEINGFLSFAVDPSFDTSSKTLAYGSSQYPVFHLEDPIGFNTTGYSIEGPSEYETTSEERNSCGYEYFFPDKFACPNLYDSFIMEIQGRSDNGIQIQRSIRAYCYLPPGQCANGGTMVNGHCQCTKGYKGKMCEQLNCNNGSVNINFGCTCNTGWAGERCDQRSCYEYNYAEQWDLRGQEATQAIFVVELTEQQYVANKNLAAKIYSLMIEFFMNDVISGPMLFTLITFDENNVNKILSVDSKTFVPIFQSILKVKGPKANRTKTVEAINEAYKLLTLAPGMIFVFTGTDPISAPPVPNIFLQQTMNSQVNIFWTPVNAVYPQFSSNIDSLVTMARQSGGRVLPIRQDAVSQMSDFLSTIPDENQLVVDTGAEQCNTGLSIKFPMEENFFSFVIDVTGVDVNAVDRVQLITPSGSVATELTTLLNDTSSLIIQYKKSSNHEDGGIWELKVRTSLDGCTIQVRSVSALRVTPGFAADPMEDILNYGPFSSFSDTKPLTYMGFKITDSNNNTNSNSSVTSLSVHRTNFTAPWIDSVLTANVSIVQKIGLCSFQFISDLFEMTSLSQQKTIVTGEDNLGFQFQRTFFFTMPSYTQDKVTCIHGERLKYGHCSCDPKWTGDYCDQRICHHGGTTVLGGYCVCAPGYYGEFCEHCVDGCEYYDT